MCVCLMHCLSSIFREWPNEIDPCPMCMCVKPLTCIVVINTSARNHAHECCRSTVVCRHSVDQQTDVICYFNRNNGVKPLKSGRAKTYSCPLHWNMEGYLSPSRPIAVPSLKSKRKICVSALVCPFVVTCISSSQVNWEPIKYSAYQLC